MQIVIFVLALIIFLATAVLIKPSSSESFENQQLEDPGNDFDANPNIGCMLSTRNISFLPDIKGSTFRSNGEELVSNIWLEPSISSNLSTLYGKTVNMYPGLMLSTDNSSYSEIKERLNDSYKLKANKTREHNNMEIYANEYNEVVLLNYFDGPNNTFRIEKKLPFEENEAQYISDLFNKNKTYFVQTILDGIPYSLKEISPVDREKITDSNYVNNTVLLGIKDNITNVSMAYSVQIDVVSVYDNEVDYRVLLEWNDKSEQWITSVHEIWPKEKYRKLDIAPPKYAFKSNLTDFLSVNLNLTHIGNPEEYKILFYIETRVETQNGYSCTISDFTERAAIPLPIIELSFNPNSLVLQTKQKAEVQVVMNTSSNMDSILFFNDYDDEDLEIRFSPDNISLPKKGKSIALMQVKSLGDGELNRIFNVSADVIFPQRFVTESNTILNNTKFGNITLYGYPQIIVKEPRPIAEQFGDLMDTASARIQNLSLTIAAIVAILTAIGSAFTFFVRRRGNKKENWDSSPVR
jgi:hypothetical protein